MKIPRWILLSIATFAIGLPSASAQGPGAESGDKEEDTVYYRRLIKVNNAADEKATAHLLVATILSNEILQLDLKFPELSPEQHEALIECKVKLESETD